MKVGRQAAEVLIRCLMSNCKVGTGREITRSLGSPDSSRVIGWRLKDMAKKNDAVQITGQNGSNLSMRRRLAPLSLLPSHG